MTVNNPPLSKVTSPLDAIIENSEMERFENTIEAQFACDAGEYVMRIRGNQGLLPCYVTWEVDGKPILDHGWSSPYNASLINVVMKKTIRILTSGSHTLTGVFSSKAELNRVWFKKR